MRIGRIQLFYFALLFCALLAVFGFNVWVGGTLTSPQHLAQDLASPPDSPQDWVIQDWAAVRYRALFRIIVRGTWSLLCAPNDAWGFYAIFVLWSFAFFYSALVALYYYLRLLAFDSRTSFIGCLVFLTLPPVLLAYKYPVFTREDPLAYLLMTLGLIAIIKSKPFWVCLISIAAALTRETTLVLPLCYFIAAEESIRKRLLVFLPPVLAYVGLRFMWGNQTHDLTESLLNTLRTPWETIAFLFCVFGALWLPYGVELFNRERRNNPPSFAWKLIRSTDIVVLILVMGSTLLLSRAREARIAFVLFPWVLPLAFDWFRSNRDRLLAQARTFSFWAFAFSVLAILSALTLFFHLTNAELMRAYLADFKNGYWLVVGVVNLAVIITLVGVMLGRRMEQSA